MSRLKKLVISGHDADSRGIVQMRFGRRQAANDEGHGGGGVISLGFDAMQAVISLEILDVNRAFLEPEEFWTAAFEGQKKRNLCTVPPKTKSSHLKRGRNPKGNAKVFQNLQPCNLMIPETNSFSPLKIGRFTQ